MREREIVCVYSLACNFERGIEGKGLVGGRSGLKALRPSANTLSAVQWALMQALMLLMVDACAGGGSELVGFV